MSITVYSSGPTCVRCRLSIDILKQAGVTFEVVDIRTDTRAHDYVTRELGYSQAPVVVVTAAPAGHHPHEDTTTNEQQHWSGFRPDRLRVLADAPLLLDDSAAKNVDRGQRKPLRYTAIPLE